MSSNATLLNNTLVNTLNANLDNTPHNTPDNTLDNTPHNTPDNTPLHPNPFSKLPLKFQKYLSFDFWLSNHFKDNGFLNNDIPFHLILSSFKSFDSSSSQINFFNHFDNHILLPSLFNLSSYGKPTVSPYAPSRHDETSVKGKKQRKSAKKTNNDNVDGATVDPATTEEKPKKQRKSAKTKEPVDPNADPATTEEKPKKQRKSSKNATNTDNDTTATVEPVVSGSNEEQPKKTKKTKKSKEAVLPPTDNNEETKVEDKTEDKPVKNTKKTKTAGEKPKKSKQPKQDEIVVVNEPQVEVTVEENIDDEEEEEDVDVTKIQIEGKEYLIDTNNNIYDIDSHDVIGSYINNVLELNP
jgi:hypothetical protein